LYKEKLLRVIPENLLLTPININYVMYYLNDINESTNKLEIINQLNSYNYYYNKLKMEIYKKYKEKIKIRPKKNKNKNNNLSHNNYENNNIIINKNNNDNNNDNNKRNISTNDTKEKIDSDFDLEEILLNDLTLNIINNNNKIENEKTNEEYLKDFYNKTNNLSTQQLNDFNNQKLKTIEIIKPIIDKVLENTDNKIKNIIFGRELERRKQKEINEIEEKKLNNDIMQQILENKKITNMFGYDINNSDDLKKYLKEYHNSLYNYIENCDKNIKSLSMLAFNNKNIKILQKEKYVFKIFRDYKKKHHYNTNNNFKYKSR